VISTWGGWVPYYSGQLQVTNIGEKRQNEGKLLNEKAYKRSRKPPDNGLDFMQHGHYIWKWK
jgi:hypothetical protein